MTREFKNYGLISTKKPAASPLLSTTVALVSAEEKRYYCYVSFTQKLIEKVGKLLPRGLSVADPAFLELVFDSVSNRWVVSARYLRDGISAELWKTDGPTPPTWARFYKLKSSHGNDSSTHHPNQTGRGSGPKASDGSGE